MNCKHYDNDFETCKNGDCPYCADYCPVTQNQEVCRYSDLDETEIARRESLDNEGKDSRGAIQALAEENQELKKQLAEAETQKEHLTPCDVCAYDPPSSFDGKPCSLCPAKGK